MARLAPLLLGLCLCLGGRCQGPTLEYPLPRGDAKTEPSCEELRTIWRLTKRAARHSLMTNEIPDRPMLDYFVDGPGLFGPRQPFGRIVLEPQAQGRRRLLDTPMSSKGSFERVKAQLRKGVFGEAPVVFRGPKYSRPSPVLPVYATKGNFVDREEVLSKPRKGLPRANDAPVVYGVYNNMGGLTTDDGKKPFQKLRDHHRQYLRARNGPQTPYYQMPQQDVPAMTKAVLKDMLAQAAKDAKEEQGFNRDTNGCKDVKIKYCNNNADCSCYGLYTCVHGKCRNYSSKSTASVSGLWHDKPVSIPKVVKPAKIRRYLPERRSAQQFAYDEGWDEAGPFYVSADMAPPSELLTSPVQDTNLYAEAEEDQPQILPHHRRKL